MKKRYKLKEEVKTTIQMILMIAILFIFIVGIEILAQDRFEKIENGEMVLVSEEYMK